MTMVRDLSRTEKTLGLILAAIIGLGAVAAVAMPMLNTEDHPGIWQWCRAEAGKKYLVCGVGE